MILFCHILIYTQLTFVYKLFRWKSIFWNMVKLRFSFMQKGLELGLLAYFIYNFLIRIFNHSNGSHVLLSRCFSFLRYSTKWVFKYTFGNLHMHSQNFSLQEDSSQAGNKTENSREWKKYSGEIKIKSTFHNFEGLSKRNIIKNSRHKLCHTVTFTIIHNVMCCYPILCFYWSLLWNFPSVVMYSVQMIWQIMCKV